MGGAGLTALVSIIIAGESVRIRARFHLPCLSRPCSMIDVVPVREIASWRSYVNMAATMGRSLGGPLGGWLCDTIGWRWCFYGQAPPTLLGLALILWKLPNKASKADDDDEELTLIQKFGRVDVAGAMVLAVAIISFLLCLDFVNKESSTPFVVGLAALCLVSMALFYFVESRWATEPILPIELLTHRATLEAYWLAGLQMAAQFGVFYSVPIYFQVASGASVSDAGLRLVPAVMGNANSGLLAGSIILKTGRYKLFTIFACAGGCVSYLVVLLRWRGTTGWADTLYLYFGGFASGAVQSTTFIHLAASLEPSKMAIAGTTLYLVQSLFLLIGAQVSTAVLHARLRDDLNVALEGVKHKSKVSLCSPPVIYSNKTRSYDLSCYRSSNLQYRASDPSESSPHICVKL